MKPKRKILSLLLAICLVAGLMPTAALAAEGDKTIMLGTSGISGRDSTNGYDYIYFGNWTAPDGYTTSGPIKWRVLDDQTNTGETGLFLLSDGLLGTGYYGGVYFDNTSPYSNTWQGSDAQAWCNTFASSNLDSRELAAILETTKSDDAFTSSTYSVPFAASENILNGDKVFFLSAEEAENSAYGFANDNARIANYGGSACAWWLRSPYAGYTDGAGAVYGYGYVDFITVDDDWAARPAFNLDLNSVLFISAAEGGKSASSMDSGLTAVNDYTGNEWKLTLLDEAHKDFNISNATITGSGDTITFSYSGAQTGEKEYISAVIEDSGAITHYGRILQIDGMTNGASGKASLTIPDGVTLSDTTKLYVFNEQYNGDKMTDYASQLKEISRPTVDTTAPKLTAGDATRTGETTATVKFTSSEAGSYYYVVNDSIAAPDSIDTSGEGASCNANEETTITLDSLSGEYIHIVVKDAANNVSDILTIQIPAYTSTTFTVTVNVDPSEGGTASADPSAAVEGDEIELTASPNEGYHFKEWQVTPDTVSIGTDNKFTMPAENVTVKAVFEAHSFTQENTDSEYLASSATCTQAATYYYSCSCGAKDTNNTFTSGEALGHTLGADWKYNDSNHWKECEDCGAKVDEAAHVYTDDADTTCDTCGYERTIEGGDEPEPGHTHIWSGEWSNNETHHWHECTAEGCPVTDNSQKDGYGAHVYTNDTDTTCDTCDYERTIEGGDEPEPGHTHIWSGEWSNNETHHWHDCTADSCTITENSQKHGYAAHTYDQQVVSDTYKASDATCMKAATYYYSCICGAKGTETFPSGGLGDHNLKLTPQVDATCTTAGKEAYYTCQTCGKPFADEAGMTEIEDLESYGNIEKTPHEPSPWQYNDAEHWMECRSCKIELERGAHVYTNDTTCDTCGYVKPTYAISASPETLDFGSKTVDYTEAPAAQTVTIKNTSNQSVTVNLPTSTNYIITAGEGFTDDTATLAPNGTAAFTVQPNTGLGVGTYAETLTVSGGNNVSASIELSFTVLETYTLTVDLNGGSGSTIGGEYTAGEVVNIDAGSRSNYRFDGWTSSNGGSFADASSASTTFIMPAADTTITATWSYNGGGGGSSYDDYTITDSAGTGGSISPSGSGASGTAGGAQAGATVTIPQTGDEMPLELIIGVLIVAGCAFVGLLVARKRKNDKK